MDFRRREILVTIGPNRHRIRDRDAHTSLLTRTPPANAPTALPSPARRPHDERPAPDKAPGKPRGEDRE